MSDVLFLQFYRTQESTFAPLPGTVALISNGFSFVWDKCKNMGDLVWIEEVPDFTDYAAMAMNPLPIEKGKVYISAWYPSHLVQAFLWGTMYPEIDFVIGGHSKAKSPTYPDLPNVRITEGLAEQEIFGMEEASKNWKLEIPEDLLPQDVDSVMYSYPIERKCYWGKCNFCDQHFMGARTEWFGNDASSLYVPDTTIPGKVIFLYEPSLSPKFLRRHYKDLPVRDDVYFEMFWRGAHGNAEALREVLSRGEGPNPEHTLWSIGVEFPSNRMLEWIGKGATVESLLENIKVLCEHNSNIVMLLISSWDNLVESDVEEATRFFNSAKEYEQKYGGNIQLYWSDLIFGLGTRMTEQYLQMDDKRERMTMDSWGAGVYKIAIDERQRELNEMVMNACQEAFPGKEMVEDRTIEDHIFPPGGSDTDSAIS